jgi:hypothetical protein
MNEFTKLQDLLEQEREYTEIMSKALKLAMEALNAIQHVSQTSNDAAYVIAKEALIQIEDLSQ